MSGYHVQPNLWGRVTTCGICGRTLTDPASVTRGIGPICEHKRKDSDMRNSELADQFLPDPPMTERLVFERHDGVLYTNVPHVVRHHSPSGFEWGYMGSGPADLALCICENVLRQIGYRGATVKCWDGEVFDAAYMMHQDFKCGWIAPLPRAGWELEYSEVRAWVEGWLATNQQHLAALEMVA